MFVTPTINHIRPEKYFGIKNATEFRNHGVENLLYLAVAMQKQINFTDLGQININAIPNLLSDSCGRVKRLQEFLQSGLAKLTLTGDVFKHSNDAQSANTHTIGLVINRNPN